MFWQTFKQNYLIKFWNPVPAVIATGILSAYYFGLTGTYWAVTGEFTKWGGHILQWFGVDISDWGYFQLIKMDGNIFTRVSGVTIIGMFVGAFVAALWANNIKLRLPQNKIRVCQALIGGIIAGFGARLAMGCNLASLFTGIPQFSLHAWFFTVATAIGTYIGVKVSLSPLFRTPVKLIKASQATRVEIDERKQRQRLNIGILFFIAALIVSIYILLNVSIKLGFGLLFGLAFGILIERSQLCFTSAFRDLWISGRTLILKAIIFGMLASTLGTYSFIQAGLTPIIAWSGTNVIIGGLLFGFGIVLAGGCETGWMYRAVEGQTHFWIVGIGNIIGSVLLAAVWDDIAPSLAFSYPKINMLESFGQIGGLLANYALLFLLLLSVLLWEKFFHQKRKSLAMNH